MREKSRYFIEHTTGAVEPGQLDGLHLTYEDERRVLAANDPRGVAYALEGMSLSDGFTPEDVDAILELDSENISMTLVHDVGFASMFRQTKTFTPTELLSAYRSGDDLALLHPYGSERDSHFREPGRELTPEERESMIQRYEDSITPEWIDSEILRAPCRALESFVAHDQRPVLSSRSPRVRRCSRG